jgi:hypothetical protein
MSIETREYFRDWWREKTGYQERARFRVPAGEEGRATDDDWAAGGEYLGPPSDRARPDLFASNLHWSIKLIVVLFVLVGLLAVRRALQ